MSNFREIVTKAVIGKAKKNCTNNFVLSPEENPNTVLGCWIINNTFSGTNSFGSVVVNGAFDVNVWYSYDNDTKTAVSTKRFSYQEKMNVPLKSDSVLDNNSEIIVRSLKQPTVTNVSIKDNTIELTIEKELGVEIVGDTKIKIAIEEDEEPWDEIIDPVKKEDLEKIDEVNDEYIK